MPPLLDALLVPLRIPSDAAGVREVVAYRTESGDVPVLRFLEELPPSVRARYVLRFGVFAAKGGLRGEYGKPLNAKRDREAQGLYEFKDISSKTRILGFSDARLMILTTPVPSKKEDELEVRFMNDAQRCRDAYWRRKEEISMTVPALEKRRRR